MTFERSLTPVDAIALPVLCIFPDASNEAFGADGEPTAISMTTGDPGSVIVPQYSSSKITVFVWGKNTILKFVGNTKYKSMKLTLQLVVVVLIALTKFRNNFSNSLYIQL